MTGQIKIASTRRKKTQKPFSEHDVKIGPCVM